MEINDFKIYWMDLEKFIFNTCNSCDKPYLQGCGNCWVIFYKNQLKEFKKSNNLE